MAQATWADELAGVVPQANEEEELWHVAIAPGEVKVLSLEQLDDLYRLEIIDDSTLVWQPGMSNWLPLSVVAGDAGEAEEPVTTQPVTTQAERSLPPPPAPPRSAPPSRLPAPPVARTVPPPPTRTAPPPSRPAPSSRPLPPPSRPAPPPRPVAPPPSTGPVATTRPAPVVASPSAPPPPAASVAIDPFGLVAQPVTSTAPPPRVEPALPSTMRPFAVDPTPTFRPAPRARSRGGALILVAALAGLVVTLYRNDVIYGVARSAGLEGAYLKLEKALGGPGFGTLRSIEGLRTAFAATTLGAAPSTTLEPTTPTASPAHGAPTPALDSSTSRASAERKEPSAVSLDSLPVEGSQGTAAAGAGARPKAATGSPAAPSPKAEPTPQGPLSLDEAIRRASGAGGPQKTSTTSKSSSSTKSSTKRGGLSDYDPMNGKL